MAKNSYQRAKIPVSVILARATARTLGGLAVLLPLCLLVGGLGHVAMYYAGLLVQPFGGTNPQTRFLYSELMKLVVGMGWGVLAFPLLDAATIYVWRQGERGEPVSPYKAFNWALSRYGRMFGPHAAAYITISLGMVIIIPGILFGLQYAFVDAITATDDQSKRPLARSQKLTAGRRGKIFRAWVPYAIWYVPAYLWLVYEAEGMGALAVLGFGTLDVLLLAVMEMAMFALYQERIDDARRAQQARAELEAAEGEDDPDAEAELAERAARETVPASSEDSDSA
ncbi:MAG: hypothetical protein H6739_16910 [Alphaproteobacteria bacterium]|nr:hypothetical protein [Alphaproteobacteria bacterium]